jgi:very-short-patch-repair endonuclease
MNREQLLSLYRKGQRDFSRQQLSGIDLREACLVGASFEGADLSHANLSSARLDHTNLTNANLHKANLFKASLVGAVLKGICFEGANLDDTIMPNNRTTYQYRVKPEKKTYARQMRNNPTLSEAVLWERLRCNKLGVKIGRQRVILGYIVDFYCASCRLVIEVDGEFHINRTQEDSKRDAALLLKGFRTIRVSADRVLKDIEGVVEEIKQAISQRQ